MLKVLLLSIGLMLVFEGLIYLLFANNMKNFLDIIKNIETNKIKTISTIVLVLGVCLIYFTLRFYPE